MDESNRADGAHAAAAGSEGSDDPYRNFRSEVALRTRMDPMPTLENLSQASGVPVEELVRYVLVRWAASGSEALLAMGPIVFEQMQTHVDEAEEAGTDAARLRAYIALRDIVRWLRASAGSD